MSNDVHAPPPPAITGDRLAHLGAFGFAAQELILLSALVTEDPLLLIGASGTGKTFLLNTISEALGLEHRHYNASLIAFDDLVGFPYPDDARESVRFLQTPATVWGAESVLIDELSRCKPEHQNRFFSLIHERRLQGLALPHLKYRWAAMNPPSSGDVLPETYLGSERLDPALADRFGLIVTVGDWLDLSVEDRRRVADPGGEGAIAADGGALRGALTAWRAEFAHAVTACPAHVTEYVHLAATALHEAGVRVSPRRTRLIARSLLAARIVASPLTNAAERRLFRDVLRASLPQRAWGEAPSEETLAAAHQIAWSGCGADPHWGWLQSFHQEATLEGKAKLLLAAPDPDLGTLGVSQFLAKTTAATAAAFALATFPAAALGRVPIGAEGIHDLGVIAQPILNVVGEVSWNEPLNAGAPATSGPSVSGPLSPRPSTPNPLERYAQLVGTLTGARQARAKQLLYYCATKGLTIGSPKSLEEDFDRCVQVFAKATAA